MAFINEGVNQRTCKCRKCTNTGNDYRHLSIPRRVIVMMCDLLDDTDIVARTNARDRLALSARLHRITQLFSLQ